jgi:Phosphate-selective porin O and P
VVRSHARMAFHGPTNPYGIRLCGFIAALGLSGLVWAADDAVRSTATGGPTLEDLLNRIDSLERRNQALETQVTELKALEGEKWLSQERADQIRGIVADVLADSEQRTSLRQDSMTAGWNDGFFLASPDGRFKLSVGGLVQPRFMWSHVRDNQLQSTGFVTPYLIPDLIEDRYGFDSNYNELVFKGHLFSPAIEYMVRTNVALGTEITNGNPPDLPGTNTSGPSTGQLYLLDAWSRIQFSDNWSFRFGQYRSPYAREQLINEANQMAVNRSTIVRNYGLWYTQGIELQYQGDDFRWNLSVDNGGSANIAGTTYGLVGANALDAPWFSQSVSYSVTTRLEWKPYGAWKDFTTMTSAPGEQQGLLLGFAYHTQGSRPNQQVNTPTLGLTESLTENYWDAWTIDAQWNFGGASLFASGFWNYVNSQTSFIYAGNNTNYIFPFQPGPGYANAYGLVIQPSVYFLPKWELFTRYEYGYIDFNNASTIANAGGAVVNFAEQVPYNVLTTGVNWYIDGQDLKWTWDIGYGIGDVGYSWQNLPAGWRISATDQIVMRTQLQLAF